MNDSSSEGSTRPLRMEYLEYLAKLLKGVKALFIRILNKKNIMNEKGHVSFISSLFFNFYLHDETKKVYWQEIYYILY